MNIVTTGKKYRLGFDIGTNSIGWAAITLGNSGKPICVLDMGVRIFQDGRNPQDGSSNAVKRRVPRSQRRRRDRYLKRRANLIQALVKCGLMPQSGDERRILQELNPYLLREKALNETLAPYELGRAIFHLNQRRGFKSNRKIATKDEGEAKKTRAEITALQSSIEESGARTLGEFLAWRLKKGETVRARIGLNLHPDRAMYDAEFNAIRDMQEPYHDLSTDQWDSLHNAIFFQRRLKPVDPGLCRFEQGERRAPRALPVAQEFRMLQEVNNLKLAMGSGAERPLEEAERQRAIARLRSGKDIKLRESDNRPAKPTRDLGLPASVSFNLARGGRKAIEGDITAKRITKIVGSLWLGLSLNQRNEIIRTLLETEDPKIVCRKAMQEWNLSEEQANAIANVPFPDGYSNLSEKAIIKILPHLEQGHLFPDAVVEAGYQHHSDFRTTGSLKRLPYYGEVLERDVVGADPEKDPKQDGEPARWGRIGNPTVHIGLNQLRRVTNKLIEAYGKPEEIVVELARELKMNREDKQKYERKQKENRERNERLRHSLNEAGVPVTDDTLMKLRLWEEQGPPQARCCPYTGDALSFRRVVSSETEIDHILPWSKTWDNSLANKVVCTVKANRDKGNRSPYEAFGHNPSGYDYSAIQDRTASLPDKKRWRFGPDAMEHDPDGFLDRQLNETRYLSRTACSYLANLYDEKTENRRRVRVVPGQVTALLRRGWGLNGSLREGTAGENGKQRDDHRHHAIDAFVVANTTEELLRQFAQAAGSAYREAEERLAKQAPPPWDGFSSNQLKPYLDRMIISHKPDHGTRGVKGKTTDQLHNETAYGLIELSENDHSKVVVRKELLDFKKRGDIEAVRDPFMRSVLLKLWEDVGGKRSEFAQQAADKGVEFQDHRQLVRRVRVIEEQRVIPIKNSTGKAYKGYVPGRNAFADIWRMRDGSWRLVIVSTFDANQPDFNIERFRPVDKKSGRVDHTAKRLMRLQIDDMGALGTGSERRIVRVRKITNAASGPFIVLDRHNEANVPKRIAEKKMKENKYWASTLLRQGFRKVGVDEIGRLLDPSPPIPPKS